MEGIFHSIGEKYLDRGGDQSSTQENKQRSDKAENEDLIKDFLERREKYLEERSKTQKEKTFRKYVSGDSGYASKVTSGAPSRAGSGYSSNHTSKSPSPVPPESRSPDRVDIRERRWLVCKSGILAVRLTTKEEPNNSFNDSIADLNSSTRLTGNGDVKDKSKLRLNLSPSAQEQEENNNLCKNIPKEDRDDVNTKKNNARVADDGMVEVELEDTGEVVRVETRFLEQARPKDHEVSDLADLEILNESEILSTLSKRYSDGIYQTKLGTSLVTVNPMQQVESICGGSKRQKRRRSGYTAEGGGTGDGDSNDMLIDQVESVYRKSVTTGTTQSLVMMGRSGAGKSCNLKKSLAYLIETSQDLDTSKLTIDKMHAMDCLLESFCSTRTSMNTHATRIVELIELQFTKDGVLAGGAVELALPDTHRLNRAGRFVGEPTFPILYQVQAALGKSNLFFPPRLLNNNAFFTPLKEDIEVSTALEDWGRVCGAMELLDFGELEQDAFWIILAVITNLGYVTQSLENGESLDNLSIDKIAKLLGVQTHDLKMVFARPNTPRTLTPSSSIATSASSSRTASPGPATPSGTLRGSMNLSSSLHSDSSSQQPNPTMADNARRLAVNLYTELLSRLVKLINRSIRPPVKQPCNMFMFDSPGFQNPSTIGSKPAAGFVDLCYNYLQEKLQDMFTAQKVDSICQGKAARKMFFERRGSTKPILNLLEKQGSRAERRSGTRTLDRRSHGSKKVRFQNTAPGLFTLLHRAGNCPWSDDQVFLQRLTAHWTANAGGATTTPGAVSGSAALMERVGDDEFVLRHCIGTNPVRYSVKGWRNISYAMGRTNLALEMLQKSNREELKIQGPIQFYPGLGISHGQGPITLDQVKATMSCLQVLVQVDAIVSLLSRTELTFVFSLLPHNLAGLCELFKKSPGSRLNQKLIRDQIRGNQILDYLKILNCVKKSRPESLLSENIDLPEAVCRIQENTHRTGLAGELWSLLQVAIFNMVTNLEMLEGTLTRSVSLPTNTISQILEPSNLLALNDGRISLNLQQFLS